MWRKRKIIEKLKEHKMLDDLNFVVKNKEKTRKLFVEKYDDDNVWFHITVDGGSAFLAVSNEEIPALINALNKILAGE
jgi:hypothetical protein